MAGLAIATKGIICQQIVPAPVLPITLEIAPIAEINFTMDSVSQLDYVITDQTTEL